MSMNKEIDCKHCGMMLQYPPRLAGKQIRCPNCEQVVSLPSEEVENIPTMKESITISDKAYSFAELEIELQSVSEQYAETMIEECQRLLAIFDDFRERGINRGVATPNREIIEKFSRLGTEIGLSNPLSTGLSLMKVLSNSASIEEGYRELVRMGLLIGIWKTVCQRFQVKFQYGHLHENQLERIVTQATQSETPVTTIQVEQLVKSAIDNIHSVMRVFEDDGAEIVPICAADIAAYLNAREFELEKLSEFVEVEQKRKKIVKEPVTFAHVLKAATNPSSQGGCLGVLLVVTALGTLGCAVSYLN